MQYMVRDRKATLNEWNVAQALDKLRMEYWFQYPIDGGRMVRGGMVIDFLIKEPPKDIPLNVDGDYWHKGEREAQDRLQDAALRMKPWLAPLVRVKGSETGTIEDAEFVLRRELRV